MSVAGVEEENTAIIPSRVRREFLILVKMAENRVGYARNNGPMSGRGRFLSLKYRTFIEQIEVHSDI